MKIELKIEEITITGRDRTLLAVILWLLVKLGKRKGVSPLFDPSKCLMKGIKTNRRTPWGRVLDDTMTSMITECPKTREPHKYIDSVCGDCGMSLDNVTLRGKKLD